MIASASLTAALAAIDGLDIPPEDKDALSKAVAADFANDTSDVSDDDAVGAMPPDMAEAYKASDTPAEDKARNLSAAKRMYKAGSVAALLSSKPKVTANTNEGKDKAKDVNPVTGVSRDELAASIKKNNETLLDMFKTAGLVNLGAKPAAVNGQGERTTGKEKEGDKDFYAEFIQPKIAAGLTRPEALSAARRKHPKEFSAWQAAQHRK